MFTRPGAFPIDFPVAVLRLEAAVSQLFTRLAQEIEDPSPRGSCGGHGHPGWLVI
jgi:hypothetical protein